MADTTNNYGWVIRFILKDLIKDGWRTTITIINLIVFLICFFCLAALSRAAAAFGMQKEDRSSLMVIESGVFEPSDSVLTDAQFIPLRELMPDQIKAVSPLIFNLLKVDTYLIQVRATPLADFQPVFHLELIEGKWPANGEEVVIGSGARAMTEWEIGKTINIFGRDFIISGIISSPGSKSSSIWMDLNTAEDLFGTDGIYQFIWINVNPGVDAEQVRTILQNDQRLAGRFEIYYVDHLYEQYARSLNDIANISSVLVFLSLLLIMFGTYGSVYLTLNERSRELIILRVVGFSSRSIRNILILRTLIQILTAFLIGWGISVALLKMLAIKYPIVVHAILIEVNVTPFIFLGGLLLTILAGWLGALLSLMRITHSNVQGILNR